jgi:hypothetical protein
MFNLMVAAFNYFDNEYFIHRHFNLNNIVFDNDEQINIFYLCICKQIESIIIQTFVRNKWYSIVLQNSFQPPILSHYKGIFGDLMFNYSNWLLDINHFMKATLKRSSINQIISINPEDSESRFTPLLKNLARKNPSDRQSFKNILSFNSSISKFSISSNFWLIENTESYFTEKMKCYFDKCVDQKKQRSCFPNLTS